MPKMPNTSAGPRVATQSPTKNVHAKAMAARRIEITTKQSAATGPYASISYDIASVYMI